MEKLDLKDRKILYHLDLNSRQSFSSLGRKVALSKDVVASRVKKLQEKEIIFNFYCYIDLSKLGYQILRYYFVLQYATPDVKNRIIEELVDNKHSLFVNSAEGQIDLFAYFAVKNIYEFQQVWKKFYRKYRNYFAKTLFSIWCYEDMYTYFNLLDDSSLQRSDREKVMRYGSGSTVKVDDLDIKILKLLAPNARIPASEIAHKLDVSALTIKTRIMKLVNMGVIKGFKVDISFSKLDLNFFRLDIYLKNFKSINDINDCMIKNSNVRSCYISLGDAADLEYEVNLRGVD
jgi:DNA-binding Lrp family transcriptional regulator